MSVVSANDPFSQHYLEIEALTEVKTDSVVKTTPKTHPFVLTLPFVIIFLVFIGVFTWQLFTRFKDFNRLMIIFVFAFIVGSIPLGVNLLNSSHNNLESKALNDYTPQMVIVNNLTPTSLTISWKTKTPSIGAIKIAKSADFSQDRMIFRDSKKTLSHQQIITMLKPNTKYYLEVFSNTLWYNQNGHPIIVTTPYE